MQSRETFREKLQTLISKFEKDKIHYLSKGYLEAQVRIDFLNPFFKALGWDIENKAHKPPHERDVIVELSPETTGRPDYNFRINGATKFFIEAKAPSVALDDINHILQAKSYAWSTKEVYFVVLTDFEEFRLYDASLKPNPRFPNEGLVFDFNYSEHPKEAQTLHLFPYWKISPEELSLPIHEKAKILRNNIFGVDIDPQAVEITMMSLYLKALEGERGLLPRKQHLLPSLGNNIKCGNSLIGYDIFEQGQLYEGTVPELRAEGRRFGTVPVMAGKIGLSDEDKSRINPFDYELFKSAKDFEEVKEYKTILKKIHTVVTGAFTYYQITQEGIKLLLGS